MPQASADDHTKLHTHWLTVTVESDLPLFRTRSCQQSHVCRCKVGSFASPPIYINATVTHLCILCSYVLYKSVCFTHHVTLGVSIEARARKYLYPPPKKHNGARSDTRIFAICIYIRTPPKKRHHAMVYGIIIYLKDSGISWLSS